MTEEKTFQLPELGPDLHPAARLLAQTVADLANDGNYTLKGQIDTVGLEQAIMYADHTAKRVHGAKNGDDAISPERATGRIVTLFASLLERFWGMGVSVMAVHGGDFYIKARSLITVQTEQRH